MITDGSPGVFGRSEGVDKTTMVFGRMGESVRGKRRLVSTVSIRIVVVAVLAISLVGGIAIYRDYTNLQDALKQDLAEFENDKRQLLKNRTSQAKGYVDYVRGQFDEAVRSEVKVQVLHAHAVASHLIQELAPSHGRDEIADIVREALRPLRWRDGRGYLFAVDLDGINQLYPPNPSIEGTDLLADPNATGYDSTAAVIELAKRQGEGFLEWRWPNPTANGEIQAKRGFVKLLKPLGWVIGTGEYLPAFETDLKKDVLARLEAYSYDDGGYVFVGQWDGVMLSNKSQDAGKDLWDIEDVNGVKVIQELVAKAKAGGGFVEYMLPKLDGRDPFRKISYVVGIPEWKWYLGTGVSMQEIEQAIADRREKGLAEITKQATYYVVFIGVVLGIFLLLSQRMAEGVASDYRKFVAFFKGAATSDTPIATESLAFAEFEELAHAANRMIAERVEVSEKLREREEVYRTMFNTNPDSINLSRISDGSYVDVNEGFVEGTGFSREEVIGKTPTDINVWADPADRDRLIAGLRERGQVTNLEARFRLKDGSQVTALMSARVVNIKGEPHVLSITRNIEKLKQAEEALRKSEEKYRLQVENQTDLIVKVDLEGRFVYVSPSYCALFGKTEDELLGRTFMPMVHEDDREATEKAMAALFVPPHVAYVEQRALTVKGWRWLAWQDTAILDADGNVREIIGAGRDIHDHKMADRALVESEGKFRRAIENMPLIGVSLDAEGRIVFANDFFLELTGYTAEEVLGQDWCGLFIPAEQIEELRGMVRKAMETGDLGGGARHENEILTKSGERLLVSWFNVLNMESGGKVTGITGMGLDVTERTRAQKALEEERRFTATVLETLADGVSACDGDGNVHLFNRALREFHGLHESDDPDLFDTLDARLDLLAPDSLERIPYDQLPLFRALRGELVRGFEMIISPREGAHRIVSVNAQTMKEETGEVTGAVAIVRDITEQKRTEEQLRHAQKMEAVGQLTGGIAHDFNNLLQVILANLQIARERVVGDELLTSWLEGASQAGWRGAKLTQQLLSFSRKQTLYPESVDPKALISGMVGMLKRTLGEHIEVRTAVDDDVPHILIDPGGLESAILNLAVNARAAMQGGGILNINCRSRNLDTEMEIENDTLPVGRYVEISVVDNGCGMSPEILDRAFEPFFTTKDVGEGSGLGLSMVYGFARQSGGNVNIKSEVDVGTTVTFLLPVAGSAEGRDAEEAEAPEAHSGGGTVLIVEDDPDVRASTVTLFRMLGYNALQAENGEEALKVLEENADIRLLFSDVIMPKGISGIDLARQAIRKYTELKVILASGYPEVELRKSGLTETDFQLLQKPYTYGELASALNTVMD